MEPDKIETLIPSLQNATTRNTAFSQLVRLTQERLYWHIRKMVLVHDDANDVLQNVYIKAWKAIDNFRGDSKLFTWLYRIASNETYTFLAQQRMRNSLSSIDYEDLLISRMQSDAHYDGDEMQQKFQQALLTLPEKQRMVFNMKYYDELKYEEISEITGTSVGALKASYHHATKKIEAFIKGDD